MSSPSKSQNKQQDGMSQNGNKFNIQSSSQPNQISFPYQIQQQKEQNKEHQNSGRVKACPIQENQNLKNGSNSKRQINTTFQDDEIHMNPDLEKYFKRREYMDQINRPMIRPNKKRIGDVKSNENEGGAQQSVNNQRRALEQIGIINKQEQNNEAIKISKLKRYQDRLSTAIRSLQSWEEPLIVMGVGKTFEEKFEIAERMLHNWQDLGLVDGPETEQMMLKYPEYEEQILEEKSQIIQQQQYKNQNQTPPKKFETSYNYNGIQEQSISNNYDFKIRKIRGGSSTARNRTDSLEQTHSVHQSPRKITEKGIKEDQQRQQSLYDRMLTSQNKYRISCNSDLKQNLHLVDEQIIKNLNESKLLEEQKNQILNNNINSLKPKYQQKPLSSTKPIQQNVTQQSEYNQPLLINNFSYGDDNLKLRTPRRIDKINTPQEYNEVISNEIEKTYKLRYSSNETNKNNQYNGVSFNNGSTKYGSSLNNNKPLSYRKDYIGSNYQNSEDNDTNSHFPQIYKHVDTFSSFSGGKSNLNKSRPETPQRKINYASTAYPHSQQLYSQPRGNTPKVEKIQQ